MTVCISHTTALGFLLRSRNPRGYDDDTGPSQSVPRRAPSDDDAHHLFNLIESDLPEDADQLDILVSTQAGRHVTGLVRPHLCTTDLPAGSLIPMRIYGTNFLMCSPELVFLQMADELGEAGLAYVGCALCSNFRLDDLMPGGVERRTDSRDKPLTTVKKIRTFLNGLPAKTRNRQKALRALAHVYENADSPPEIGIALCLGMPTRLGGDHLGSIQLSPPIKIYDGRNEDGSARYSIRHPDVLVTAKDSGGKVRRVDVEYSPLSTHGALGRGESDVERTNLISSGGSMIEITLTTSQVQHYSAFRRQVDRIRRALRQRKTPRLTGDPSSPKNRARVKEADGRRFELWQLVLGEGKMQL